MAKDPGLGFRVLATVTGVKGRCNAGHQEGDHFEISCHNPDGFVKSPSAAFRLIFRHCGVRLCTPRSSRFARLASGAFYCAVYLGDFLRSH